MIIAGGARIAPLPFFFSNISFLKVIFSNSLFPKEIFGIILLIF